jgi:hypothetical protein
MGAASTRAAPNPAERPVTHRRRVGPSAATERGGVESSGRTAVSYLPRAKVDAAAASRRPLTGAGKPHRCKLLRDACPPVGTVTSLISDHSVLVRSMGSRPRQRLRDSRLHARGTGVAVSVTISSSARKWRAELSGVSRFFGAPPPKSFERDRFSARPSLLVARGSPHDRHDVHRRGYGHDHPYGHCHDHDYGYGTQGVFHPCCSLETSLAASGVAQSAGWTATRHVVIDAILVEKPHSQGRGGWGVLHASRRRAP